MVTIINSFLDKLFLSHNIILYNGDLTLINIDVGLVTTYVILVSLLTFIAFLGFKLIRWFINIW